MATFLTESKFERRFTQVMNMSAPVPVFTQSCLLLITAAWFKKKNMFFNDAVFFYFKVVKRTRLWLFQVIKTGIVGLDQKLEGMTPFLTQNMKSFMHQDRLQKWQIFK